jgi:hypothetical protein
MYHGRQVRRTDLAQLTQRRIELVEQRSLDLVQFADCSDVVAKLLRVQGVDAVGPADGLAQLLDCLMKAAGCALAGFTLRQEIGRECA